MTSVVKNSLTGNIYLNSICTISSGPGRQQMVMTKRRDGHNDGDDDEDEEWSSQSSRGQLGGRPPRQSFLLDNHPASLHSAPPGLHSAARKAAALDESHNWSDRLLLVKLDLPQQDF